MTKIGTILIAASLAFGAVFPSGVARAQLGTGSTALGTGGEAIGASPQAALTEGPRAAAPRVVGNCVTNRTAYRTQINTVNTTSQPFAIIPNTHFPVTHQAGCIVVDFAAALSMSDTSNAIRVRAWIAGVGAAEPPDVLMGPPGSTVLGTRSMRFVFPNVPAGTHTIRMEWRSGSGNTVGATERTLTVQYR